MKEYADVEIVGRVGLVKSPYMVGEHGSSMRFDVCVNRRFRGKDRAWQEEKSWFAVAAFDEVADWCNQFVEVGKLVRIEGRLEQCFDGGWRRTRVVPEKVELAEERFLTASECLKAVAAIAGEYYADVDNVEEYVRGVRRGDLP